MTGLKQRIKSATSIGELDSLLSQGKSYENASDGTRRQWNRESAKRRKQLTQELISK